MATPKTEVGTNISQKNISLVAEKIGPDLIKLIKEFQLDDAEIKKLYKSRINSSIKARMVINWWLQRNGTKATNEKLVEALDNIGRKQLADELVNKSRVMQSETSPDTTCNTSKVVLTHLKGQLDISTTEQEVSENLTAKVQNWNPKCSQKRRNKSTTDEKIFTPNVVETGKDTSPSNKDELDSTNVKVIVDNIAWHFLPLAKILGLSVTEQAQLEKGTEDLTQKVYKMIQWWKERKGNQATKSSMITALRNIGRNDLADTVSTGGQQTPIDLTKFKQRLTELYSHQNVPQPPGIKKNIGIDDIFIDQQMKTIEKREKWETEIYETIAFQLAKIFNFANHDTVKKIMDGENQFLQIQSLIQQFNEPNILRILLEADPGFGKTTLSVKLASDWAKKRQYITSLFDLLILIPLREVGSQSIQDVIVKMINRVNVETPITTKHLNDYLSQNKVLLILDGYDEMSMQGMKLLQPLIMKEMMEKTNILVTSRRGFFSIKDKAHHSSSALLLQEQVEYDFWDLRVFIRGISAKQRNELLRKHFQIDFVKLSQMNELFAINVNEIFECPLLVFWLGWMLEKEDVEQIQTRTEFYKRLVNLILHKTQVREKVIQEKDKVDIFSTTSDSQLNEDVFKLGNICLQRIMNPNVLFRQSDLTHLEDSVLLKSDLLVSFISLTKTIEEETIYQFMHRSFLEFIAAYSVCYSIDGPITFDQFNQKITNLVNEGLSPSEDSLFFPFVVGLMDQNPDWLFRSLLPWASLNAADDPKMINLFLELNQEVDDNLIQLLLNFIPTRYILLPFQGISQSYFSSSFLKRLLERAAYKQLISVMYFRIDIYPFPISSITLHRLYLMPQNIEWELSFAQCSIHCKELIYYVTTNMNSCSWNRYLPISRNISADQRNLNLQKCNSSTCSLVLQETAKNWSETQFHRVLFNSCNLEDQHVDAITQLVNNNRITKSVSIIIAKNAQLSVACVNRLWESVIRSKLLTEFSFYNFNSEFIPIFQLIPPFYTKSFHLLNFFGRFKFEPKESFANRNSIQQLTLINFVENVNVTNVVSNFSDVNCFEFHSRENCLFLEIPFLSSVTELNLYLDGQFDVSSLIGVMPSLTTLILSVEFISSNHPPIQDLMLSRIKLRMLGLHLIKSFDLFEFLINCLTKIETIELQCLQLLFLETCQLKSKFNSLCVLQNLLKDKHIQVLSIGDVNESIELCHILPCWFPQEHFQFRFKIVGDDENDFIWSQRQFQHNLNSPVEYHVESKK